MMPSHPLATQQPFDDLLKTRLKVVGRSEGRLRDLDAIWVDRINVSGVTAALPFPVPVRPQFR